MSSGADKDVESISSKKEMRSQHTETLISIGFKPPQLLLLAGC